MGINPMGMSAGMYGGFGGPSMGMNGIGALGGMNAGMGMGFNAMNSGFNGWNGNSAWNSGQNNFNPNTFGMNANRMGDFGSNSGFNSASGRHDQMHQPQFAQYNLQGQFQHRQGQHQQSRGRNPGFGRGNNGFPGRNADIQPFPQQIPSQTNPAKNNLRESSSQQQTPAPANENKIAESAAEGSNIENKDAETKPDEVSKELGGADSTAGTLKPPGTPEPAGNEHDRTTEKPELPLQMDVVVEDSDKIQVLRVPETVVLTPDTDAPLNVLPNGIIPPSGPAALMNQGTSFDVADRGRGGFRGGFGRGNGVGIGFHGRGHGSWSTLGGASSGLNANKHTMNSSLVSIPSEPRGVGVAGAPTAPKALREGLPNVGLRGRLSYQLSTRVSASTNSVEKAKRYVRVPQRNFEIPIYFYVCFLLFRLPVRFLLLTYLLLALALNTVDLVPAPEVQPAVKRGTSSTMNGPKWIMKAGVNKNEETAGGTRDVTRMRSTRGIGRGIGRGTRKDLEVEVGALHHV